MTSKCQHQRLVKIGNGFSIKLRFVQHTYTSRSGFICGHRDTSNEGTLNFALGVSRLMKCLTAILDVKVET